MGGDRFREIDSSREIPLAFTFACLRHSRHPLPTSHDIHFDSLLTRRASCRVWTK